MGLSEEPDGMGAEARDYLADDFNAGAEDHPSEDAEECYAFEDFLRALPADDGRPAGLANWLHPFLENDERLDGDALPDAMRFMVSFAPGSYPPVPRSVLR
jgi:hypothetical protein